ncbi:transcriptional regulator GlxA family with amidase domain [Aestuariispira insulae]|uniref:Transcriptional regulator GlxA family with amidase domain n=2 Tax=Aestuariispira insulae TaxID=1461337 RepID=A0A3D9H5A1_9PROT|nr:transcriptional regulator GlxA family with amidase domain [Aestuariispira insulae]
MTLTMHNPSPDPALTIGILLLDGFNLTSFSNIIDVLRLAGDKGLGGRQRNCRWTLLAPGNSRIRSSCGIDIAVEKYPPAPTHFDYLIVFGNTPGEDYFVEKQVRAYLKTAHAERVVLAGIGGGAAALVATGVTGRIPVCVHWYHQDDYLRTFGAIPIDAESLFREEAGVITCAGGAAATDLAISLVGRHLGPAWADKCQRMMLLDQVRKPDHIQSVPVYQGEIACPVTKRAVRKIEHQLTMPINIDDLAKSLNIGRRQLERKFRAILGKGIHELIREMRLHMAIENIRNSDRTILDIALSCGFPTVEHFNSVFKAHYGHTPTQIRQQTLEHPPCKSTEAYQGLTQA